MKLDEVIKSNLKRYGSLSYFTNGSVFDEKQT
jgi:hypothetical protein